MAYRVTREGQMQDELGIRPDLMDKPTASQGTTVDAPGPSPEPGTGQGGEPPQAPPPPPPPPAIASTVPGVQGSEATGGVQGSFLQAGTSGFNQRFGGNAPALWYRRTLEQLGGPSAGRAQKAAREGGTTGGSGVMPPVAGDETGGRPGDADWQRFMQEVRRKMFGA